MVMGQEQCKTRKGNNLLANIEKVSAPELPVNYERLQKAMRNIEF
tara:strand:- start:1 stop:135 length:135 start_codon:yes stop_codon:yes gene_type:complete